MKKVFSLEESSAPQSKHYKLKGLEV